MSFLALVLDGDQLDRHMARALVDAGGPPERTWPVALDRRALIYVDPPDLELVRDELVVVLRVGDRGVEELQHVPRRRPRRVKEYGTGIVHRLAADVVDHEARLARGGAHVPRPGAHHHGAVRRAVAPLLVGLRLGVRALAAATASLRLVLFLAGVRRLGLLLRLLLAELRLGLGGVLVLLGLRGLGAGAPDDPLAFLVAHRILALSEPACPRNRRVGAHTPHLWPTLGSVM